MKKFLVMLLAMLMIFALVACQNPDDNTNDNNDDKGNIDDGKGDNGNEDSVMSYADYIAADVDAEVVVECYVQAHQSWWDNKITVYAADKDGAYFIYEMACSEDDAAKLTAGTKIKVSGVKGEWSGEIEIMDATFEFVEGADLYVAEAKDVTELLGTDELINSQNQLVSFNNLFIKNIEYKNGEPGDDIYVTVGYKGADYSFCVERYLTGPDTDVYKAVQELAVGDVVNVEGFLYWYEGVNTHITAVEKVATMSYADYVAADLDDVVVVETYVQAHQSWWDNKVTVYTQDADGAYFLYEMACSEEDAAKLTAGAKIKVAGYKGEWAGEVEVVDCHFIFVEAEPFVAEAKDVTALLGTDELINDQNKFVAFKGLTIKAIEYKGGEPGDDIYVTVTYNGADYSFCVERYLTDPDTDVYKAAQALKAGDVVDVEGFLYWYEGVNTHITKVTVK